MDLSLLSDAEICTVDARIRALWAAPLRCTLAAPGASLRAPPRDEMLVHPDGATLGVYWNGAPLGYHFLDEPRRVKSAPMTADEAFEAWRAAVQRIFHEVHHWGSDVLQTSSPSSNLRFSVCVNGRATGPYRIVCASDKAEDLWLARETLMPASRERLLCVCPRRT